MSKEQNAATVSEDDELQQVLDAAKQMLRLATQDILKRGLLIEEKDWQGELVQKVNPSVKLQKEAAQVILSLRNLRLQEAKAKAGKKGAAAGASHLSNLAVIE